MKPTIEPGFSKNGVLLVADNWYLAKRDKDLCSTAWYCKYAFRGDDTPKLLRHPSSLTWDNVSKKFVHHTPSPYDFDYDFHVERELTECEVAQMYQVEGYCP